MKTQKYLYIKKKKKKTNMIERKKITKPDVQNPRITEFLAYSLGLGRGEWRASQNPRYLVTANGQNFEHVVTGDRSNSNIFS